jgi:hypothetical protein
VLPVQSYVWRRVQVGVSRFIGTVTGLPINAPAGTPGTPARVVWGTYDIAQVPKPFISLQRLGAGSSGEPQTYIAERATQQTIVVTETTVGAAVRLWLAFAGVEVIVLLGATLTTTRDALLLALRTQVEPLEFAASGPASIIVTPKGTQITNVTALVGCTVSTDALEYVEVESTTRKYRTRIQIYGGAGDGDESIDEYADAILMALRVPRGLVELVQYGLGVEGVPETANDISSISGPLQERRLYFDVIFVASSVIYIRDVETLDEVEPPEIAFPVDAVP